MIPNNQIWELAESYESGSMHEADRLALESRLEADPAFAAAFRENQSLLRSLVDGGRRNGFRHMLADIHVQEQNAAPKTAPAAARTIPLRTHYLRTAGIAAGMALLTSLSTLWWVSHKEKKTSSQVIQLERKVAALQRGVAGLKPSIEAPAAPPPGNYSATGFALTNDGYLVTNYHVTQGADSVYIRTRDGLYYKATPLAFDEHSDVAILKVDQKNFRFSKGELPYTIADAKTSLGARVFTLGFPQEEIVYNEGYISSVNGYLGDSMQYRLNLPSKPGQSGSPVLDAAGNVVAVISMKESQSEGDTYAVSTKAIVNLIDRLEQQGIELPRANKLQKLNRVEKVQKIEEYTCMVQVYKRQ